MRVFCWFSELISRLHRQHHCARWRDALPPLTRDLELLAGSTEGEFLAIGEKLQDFYIRAEELSRTCSTIAAHMAGKEVGTVIEGFREVIEAVNRLESGSRRNTDYLRSVLEKIERLDGLAKGFDKTIMLLRVLCVSIRIESARLGDRDPGFETLAEEVEKLSGEIQDRCFKLHGACQSLSLLIRKTLGKVLELEAARQEQAGIVLEKTMSGLKSLLEKHAQSSKAAEQISAHYEAVSRRIGEIVLSMQFHDITRQRIEHTREALDGLLSSDPNAHKDPGLAGDIAALQTAQLKYAGDELVSAVNNILDNLSSLANLIEEMAGETSRLAGTDDKAEHSFLAQIETGFSSVISALGTYGESDRNLSTAMDSVTSMFGEISAQAGSIESIGAKIKLISLNAIVKACHIGDEGASLAVLAESTHHLSVETCKLTEKASEALSATISASESLRAAVFADLTGEEGKPAFICEALRTQFATLENVNQDLFSTLARVNTDGRTLSQDVRKAVEAVGVHHRIHEGLADIVAKLEEIAAYLRSKVHAGDEAGTEKRMEALKAVYTMEAERNVHEAMLHTSSEQQRFRADTAGFQPVEDMDDGEPEGETQEANEEDLGDNVELF
ncbi:MAG: hypothetical protein P4L55_15330 [Syntrophobacteraceae bacterium]|nr:hypothetical protein [Syntrophobacteraceae bacterium]